MWELNVKGQIANNTWVNLGVRWLMVDFTDSTMITGEEDGGLELFINGRKVGQSLLPNPARFEPVTNYLIDGVPPPVLMVGCHYDYDSHTYTGFSDGEFDEVAIWDKFLVTNSTHDQSLYFLGGFGKTSHRKVSKVLGHFFHVLLQMMHTETSLPTRCKYSSIMLS